MQTTSTTASRTTRSSPELEESTAVQRHRHSPARSSQDALDPRLKGLTPLASTQPGKVNAMGGTVTPEISNRFAFKVTSHLRNVIAEKTEIPMLASGSIWQGTSGTLPARSTQNIQRLKAEIVGMNRQESDFFERFKEQPMFATHFTYAPDTKLIGPQHEVNLLARKNLMERRASFDHKNTEQVDLEQVSNDDYVFLSLECGVEPQKKESRFGDNLYRFDLGDPRFEHAWMSLNDMANPKANGLERWIPELPPQDYEFAKRNVATQSQPAFVFYGKDMKEGLGLSIVHSLRQMSPEARDTMLAARTPEQMNSVINGLFRPEVKVPRFLISKDFQKHDVDSLRPVHVFAPGQVEAALDTLSDIGADSDDEYD